jgi:DNA-binding transcriptional ArsR family regulator
MARTATPAESPVQRYRLPTQGRVLPMVQTHDCVTALRALGEETRVRIVGLLIDHAMDVSTISDALGVSPYNVSKHLRILREAGLLEVEKDGRQRLYALPDTIRREAAAGRILDLGCCSFQFEGDVNAAPARAGEGAARPRRPAARAGRAPRSAGRTSR